MSKNFNIFFDTEFTDFRPNFHHLISIGMVAQDGREIYFELLDTWATHQCSQFVIGEVLPLLDNDVFHKEQDVAERLQAWIEGFGDEVEVVLRSDSQQVDWDFVAEMFQFYGCWPKNMRRKCGTIYFDNHHLVHRYQSGLAEFWKSNKTREHHALVDARSLAFAWKYAIRRGMGRV